MEDWVDLRGGRELEFIGYVAYAAEDLIRTRVARC